MRTRERGPPSASAEINHIWHVFGGYLAYIRKSGTEYPLFEYEYAISLVKKQSFFLSWRKVSINSADADGGPRSRVRTAGHSAQPPIDVSGNFSAHGSAE